MIIKRADYISDDPTPKVEGGGVALTLKAERRGCIITYQTVAGTLNPGGHPGSYNGQDAYNDMLVTQNEVQNDGLLRGGETSQTLDASYYKGTGARNGKEREIVAMEPAYMSDRKGHNGITEDGTATTLTAQEKERPIVFDKEMYNYGKGFTGMPQARTDNIAPTVRSDDHLSGVCTSIVRRLTPKECERLQGYPDGWTDIGEWTDSKGKRHKDADSPRYKALGNSIALPFWAWLARRICAQYERPMTMASLFDGIGGFPLVFSRAGAVPVWASEIEEFPIAVTKLRFPEPEDDLWCLE